MFVFAIAMVQNGGRMDTKKTAATIISRFLSVRYFLKRSGASRFLYSIERICVKHARMAQINPMSRA